MESEGHSSEGQSSGGKKKKAPRKDIQYKLHPVVRTVHPRLGLGQFILEMPSGLKNSKLNIHGCPSMFLDLKDDDQRENFEIMKKMSHPNILEVYLMDGVKGEECKVYVEVYSGVLSDLLNEISFINRKTGLVPSAPFQDIVSDVVDGFNHIFENDEYHGNFAWDTTFYSKNATKTIVKLANFERRFEKLPLDCQVADCVSLGYALDEISQRLQQVHAASTCCLIDDLSQQLISVTQETFKKVMRDIKNSVFFWDERRRKTFYAVEVPEAWYHAAFIQSFTQSQSVPTMPWTNEKYNGYLGAMEVYQEANHMYPYEANNWRHCLRCISGMYTHEKELVIKMIISTVDSAVHQAHPRLSLDLKVAVDQANQPVVVDQANQPVVPAV